MWFFFLSRLRPPRATRTDTLFPYQARFRSRRDGLAALVDRGDHFGEEAEAASVVGEGHDIAATPLAEDEVGAGDDPGGAVAGEEDVGDEILGGRARHGGVEGDRKSTRLNSSH